MLYDDLLKPGVEITEWNEQTLADNAVGIQPGAPIRVRASEGALTGVRIGKADGSTVRGTLSEDGTEWSAENRWATTGPTH